MDQGAESSQNGKITIADIRDALKAEVVCGEDKLGEEVKTACGCDLMSDVLAFTQPGSVLLTGLTNQQVIRTAEMLDLKAVVFVRAKNPEDSALQLAKDSGLPLLLSPYPLYESCGLLYNLGLLGCGDAAARAQMNGKKKDTEDPTKMPCGALWWGD